MKIRALIVEDEPLAIDRLRGCLAHEEGVELIGEVHDGPAAVAAIDHLTPDLIFLDVHLPGFSGLEVLRQTRRKPGVIFTTAHDQYALQAFEWGAFDYLVKPYSQDRLRLALRRLSDRAVSTSSGPALNDRVSTALQTEYLQRFFVRHANSVLPVHVEEIVSITAEDDYSAVHVDGKQHLVYLPLREFARRLNPNRFIRIHRSTIVNLDHVVRVESLARRLLVHLRDGSRVIASRAGAGELRRFRL